MARAIDAVQVLHNINLHHRPTPVSEWESGFNNGLNQAMWEITHAPTLTQPNEPLTLEELREMEGKPFYDCASREWYIVDFVSGSTLYTAEYVSFDFGEEETEGRFYRRPPEGEEEEKHVIEITENL